MNQWYKQLKTAPWNPPDYVFGIVWPILYFLMFISFVMVFMDKKCYPYCYPMTIFIVQLILNLSWTTIFFTYRQIKFALFVLFLIFGLTLVTTILFYKINKIAGLLLIPYLLWLCVAISLNSYIVAYN
jgi:benzodiazapine receptor